MSGGTWLTIKGMGFAPGAKVFLGTARAPARTVDSHTLLALSPPGLAGDVAVRVEQGVQSTAKGRAFQYQGYGFKGPWKKINLSSPRGNWPGVSLLRDGRVLITGGVADSSGSSVEDTADVYDPATTHATLLTGKMSAPRWTQAQVTLLNGKTLILGTWMGGYSPPSGPVADLFDGTVTFAPTRGRPATEHRWPHAALLADGRVLVTSYAYGVPDVYDPGADSFAPIAGAPDLTGYRPVRLLDGRVLLVRGGKSQLYVYDPDGAGSFSAAGQGPTASNGDLWTLPDGRVLYVAGTIASATETLPTDVIEIYDPKSSGFTPAPYRLAQARQKSLTTAMVGDGTVLVIGGEIGKNVAAPACSVNTFVITSGVERIDALAGAVTSFDPLPEKNFVMSATTLLDGSVVAAGGAPCGGAAAYPYFYFLQGTPPPK